MKQIKIYTTPLLFIISVLWLTSCNKDFLDRQPLASITPEKYLWEESQLAAYTIQQYGTFPTYQSHGNPPYDNDTDNHAYKDYSDIFVPGQWRVAQNGGDWGFSNIYKINYYLNTVVPRWKAGKINGNSKNVNHYIGEGYFLRAYEYFDKVKALGDFPIIKKTFPDELAPLVEASKRAPRSEVVRFIISDLDSAIVLCSDISPDGQKNRISKNTALLLKSRVALYEATWLKYFKGTAFVPNGTGWPGAAKVYNKGWKYQAGTIDAEIDWLLDQAMQAASVVADNVGLVPNNGVLQQDPKDPSNPYFDMFGAQDMSGYSEVLLWKRYDAGLEITHRMCQLASTHNQYTGTTRSLVNSFLMSNGLPIYDASSGYHGDDFIADVRKDRDQRLWMFLKEPGQKNLLFNLSSGSHSILVEPSPVDITSSANIIPTGYALRKYINYDGIHYDNGKNFTGCIIFRAVEAYLNYMEACYEKNGALDGKARQYWSAIRARAGVDTDFNKTIAATVMAEEAKTDWGAYSAGSIIDPTLYNIRRERRNELMAERLRADDIRRWRAMDQIISTPYHIEGFKLWGPIQENYKDAKGKWTISWGTAKSNVSSPERSKYIRPYEITGKELVYNGYKWHMAHYLAPIALQHFLVSSEGNDLTTSPIYQNPGWPTEANVGPIDF
jgi:hypothetical protein